MIHKALAKQGIYNVVWYGGQPADPAQITATYLDTMVGNKPRMYKEGITSADVDIPKLKADYTAKLNDTVRSVKVADTKAEGIARISAQVSALSSMEMVEFMVSMWPMLDTASAPIEINNAKDLYQYTKGKITWLKTTATDVEVATYDPVTDLGWPI